MNYKAAIFDIDDTLFDMKTKTFIPSAIEGLRKLKKKGIKIILATGRPPQTATAVFDEDVEVDYVVCVNGSIILNNRKEIISQKVFPKELVERVYDYCKDNDIGLLWKYPDLTYEYIHKPIFDNFYNKTKNSRKKVVFGVDDEHTRRLPNGGCIGSTIRQANRFNATFARECQVIIIDGNSSDLLLYGVNKLSGVEEVLKKEGIDFVECIGFGDNNNDIEILQKVKTSVCVGNGSNFLKEKVDYITDDINDDGIYKALVKFGLIDNKK